MLPVHEDLVILPPVRERVDLRVLRNNQDRILNVLEAHQVRQLLKVVS